jgi:hypothetical protein
MVFPFGKFTIQGVPKWLLKDSILEDLSKRDRDSVRQATHALVSEYNANSWGHPDPEWTGTEPKGIQEPPLAIRALSEHVHVDGHAITRSHYGWVCRAHSDRTAAVRSPRHHRDVDNRPTIEELENLPSSSRRSQAFRGRTQFGQHYAPSG